MISLMELHRRQKVNESETVPRFIGRFIEPQQNAQGSELFDSPAMEVIRTGAHESLGASRSIDRE